MVNQSSEFDSTAMVFSLGFIVLLVTCIFTFGLGLMEALDRGDCRYHSIVSFFPARIIGSELGKQRW